MLLALLLSSASSFPEFWYLLLLAGMTHCVFGIVAGLVCMLRHEAEPIPSESGRELPGRN